MFTDRYFILHLFHTPSYQYKLENTKGAIKNGQYRETGNIGYTRRRKTNQKHSTIYVGHCYAQANTNNVHELLNIENNVEIKTKTRIHRP